MHEPLSMSQQMSERKTQDSTSFDLKISIITHPAET